MVIKVAHVQTERNHHDVLKGQEQFENDVEEAADYTELDGVEILGIEYAISDKFYSALIWGKKGDPYAE